MTTDEISGKPRVPVGELEELVDEWEVFAEVTDWNDYNQGVSEGVTSCADELEALIERYDYE